MAGSARTPLWKRLVIILSAVAVGIVVPYVVGLTGASVWLAYAAGVVAALVALWVVAALLHVHLRWQGWE